MRRQCILRFTHSFQRHEKPALALRRRGVRYIELRSVDVNASDPLGVNEEQLRFLEALAIFCLLTDSPPINLHERGEIDRNQGGAAHRGRDPELHLQRNGRELKLVDWAREICDAMQGVCEVLDEGRSDRPYTASLRRQRERVDDPGLTPSAQMLAEMRENGEGFYRLAERKSLEHRRYFQGLPPNPGHEQMLVRESEASWERQEALEAADEVSFTEFLERYFSQV